MPRPSARQSPSASSKWPGSHPLRQRAALALRQCGAYVHYKAGHPLRDAYGRLFDAVAEQMARVGDASAVNARQLRAAYKQARLDQRGFLLRVSEDEQRCQILPPKDAKHFVGGLVRNAGLYNKPASQKKRDPTERNRAIYKRAYAYLRRDLACTQLPEPFVDEIRSAFSFYADSAMGKPLASKKTACRRLLQAQGYVHNRTDEVGNAYGTKETYERLFAAALATYQEQNEYLTVGDIRRLARETGHDMCPNDAQRQTVEAAMRTLLTYTRTYLNQQYISENKMRFFLERAIVLASKDTLNRDDLSEAMAAASLSPTCIELCRWIMPAGEFSAIDLAGTAGTRP